MICSSFYKNTATCNKQAAVDDDIDIYELILSGCFWF